MAKKSTKKESSKKGGGQKKAGKGWNWTPKKEHTGLKIIGIFLWMIPALVVIVLGFLAAIAGSVLLSSVVASLCGATLIGIAILVIVIGILEFYIGYALFKERWWAFWLTFVLVTIGMVGNLLMLLFSGLRGGILSSSVSLFGLIFGILLFIYYWVVRKDFYRK